MTEERLYDGDSGNGSHEETLEDLVWKYVEAFKNGQTLDKDAILHAHLSLGRDLIQHLEAFHDRRIIGVSVDVVRLLGIDFEVV